MIAQRFFRGSLALPALLLSLALSTVATAPAHAGGIDENVLDATAITSLQQRAEQAQPRDQCFLYTQLIHQMTELAGRQMAAGEDEQAALTLSEVDRFVVKIEKSAIKAKQLKNAEQLLEHTSHRLADMARVAAAQQRDRMQSTLHHLDAVHSSVLALVFAE